MGADCARFLLLFSASCLLLDSTSALLCDFPTSSNNVLRVYWESRRDVMKARFLAAPRCAQNFLYSARIYRSRGIHSSPRQYILYVINGSVLCNALYRGPINAANASRYLSDSYFRPTSGLIVSMIYEL